MSKFNTPAVGTKTVNLAGGEAFQQTSKLELVSILLTSFLKDQFYRTEADTVARLRELMNKADPKFIAKAAIFARREFGMRSISHFVAAELGNRVKGAEWTKNFFKRVVRRPDDVLEILACHQAITNKGPIPNAMKKGLGAAMSAFSAYDLAKYRKTGSEFSMIDAANLLRPRSSEALQQLMKGTLPAADTWETKITQAGQAAGTDEERADLKGDEWARLVTEKQLGYMALVRNLRNILTHAPQVVDLVCEQLVNEQAIKKSLMFPFRFLTAIDVVKTLNTDGTQKVMRALNRAIDLSLPNVPQFEGRTLVVLDESGSMTTAVAGTNTAARIGSVFAATLLKALGDRADLMTFSDNARYQRPNVDDSTLTIAESIVFSSGGTNFHAIFPAAKAFYDRVIILSDMQGWIGGNAPTREFADYTRKWGKRPRIFSFDLAGHGTMQFPEPEVYCLAGFSDKVFEIMSRFEHDKNALITTIEATDI